VNSKTKTNTVCKVSGITLNYATAQLVNFDRVKDMILGSDTRNVVTVCTERENKRKKRKCDGTGPSSADIVPVVSELEEKVYRVSFHKSRQVDDFESVPFGFIKGKKNGSASRCVS
jgi:hypothetical protein